MVFILIVIAVLLLVLIGMYNGLVSKRNNTENAFASIDVMLKKRYDLIPNLVATVKQYATHEYNTFSKITELRTKQFSQLTVEEKTQLDKELSNVGRQFLLIAENYPDLKASDNFEQLQHSLNEVEEQLSAARRTYNAVITDYNNSVETFPSNIIAGMFGFKRKMVFDIPEAEKQNVDVKSLFNS